MANTCDRGVAAFWPETDTLRLLRFLGARGVARVLSASAALHRRLAGQAAQLRKCEAEPAASASVLQEIELRDSLAAIEQLLAESSAVLGDTVPSTVAAACEQLLTLEALLHTEMRYVHAPDYEVKPGKLITKKGTWLKRTTRFSWEIPTMEKLYLPEGVAVPVLQFARVVDRAELELHDWSAQHVRVWLKPSVIEMLEARRDVWFIYWPHIEGDDLTIFATVDTWLKRSTQMSGELEPFELIYVPKGMAIHLSVAPEVVTEEWEKDRHPHVQQHRKVTLAAPPLTMRRDKYDIFLGQSPDDLEGIARLVA
mmetsp:Transcript_106995/g.300996  ORF Transcript_106995/g.300996 Transcript_106995/m.300996 type:complete len:311 (-) Transcript_106995:154-1086(-)